MSNALINNLPIIDMRLQLSRFGRWTADVVVDVTDAGNLAEDAAASISMGGGQLTFHGTVYRVDDYADTVMLRVVGGANGLAKPCKPRFYSGVVMANPLRDVLQDAGEALASSSQQALLQTPLTFWTLVQQPAALALSLLATAGSPDAVWRSLPDGTVFLGVDTYPTSELQDFQLIDYRPQDAVQVIAAEVPNVFPGESFGGRNVSAVEHQVDASGSRARVWFEA